MASSKNEFIASGAVINLQTIASVKH